MSALRVAVPDASVKADVCPVLGDALLEVAALPLRANRISALGPPSGARNCTM